MKEGGEMRKRIKEMKNGVIDKDKERKLFTLETQPDFPNNILRKRKHCLRTNQLTNSIEQSICWKDNRP